MYEAMNDAGHSKTPLILILNDNAMSISKNVGAVSKHLRSLRMSPFYFRFKTRDRKLSEKTFFNRQTYRKYIKANKTFLPQACNPYNDF